MRLSDILNTIVTETWGDNRFGIIVTAIVNNQEFPIVVRLAHDRSNSCRYTEASIVSWHDD